MADEKILSLPGSSWETVKKIIRAFYAAQSDENANVESIAKLAAVPRPVVSMNNNFLRSLGIVRGDQWKLTDVGLRYGTAMQMGNASMAKETLTDIVRSNLFLNQLLRLLIARGEMKSDTFKAEALIRLILSPTDRQAQFVKPVFDMLEDAGLIKMDGDMVSLVQKEIKPITLESLLPPSLQRESRETPAPPSPPSGELPILLGPNRIVYLRLPDDWNSGKDLPKLLKLLEISLGDGM
jgi:hypothetical protein